MLMAISYILQPRSRFELDSYLLLHDQGEGTTFQSAEIEVIWNNEDRRLSMIPTDKVCLTWSLGHKKNTLMLNGKTHSIQEWDNMLTTAGMNRENYFIVRQGETGKLATASSSDRLKMLEDFAGLSDYEQKCEKIESSTKEARECLVRINGQMDNLKAKIEGIAEQKLQLDQYTKLDKQKRGLTVVLAERNKASLEKKVRELQGKQDSGTDELEQFQLKIKQAKNTRDNAEEEREELQEELDAKMSENRKLQENLEESVREYQKVQEVKKTTQKEIEERQAEEKTLRKEETNLTSRTDASHKQLQTLDSKVAELSEAYEAGAKMIHQKELQLKLYYARQGHRNQFDNSQDRKEWLNSHVGDLHRDAAKKQQIIDRLDSDLVRLEQQKIQTEASLEENTKETERLRHQKNSLIDGPTGVEVAKREVNSLAAEGKKISTLLIRREEDVSLSNRRMREAYSKLRSKPYLRSFLDGINSVQKVMAHLRNTQEDQWVVNGYNGVVADHITCRPELDLAVSVSLGNKLFAHIVSSANVATKILSWMKKLSLPGETSFLPIDKLYVEHFNCPNSVSAKSMLKLVQFPDELEIVFKVSTR